MGIAETGLEALRGMWARLPLNARSTETSADRRGARIAVIGNCQARGVAHALEVLLPTARVRLFPASRMGKGRRGIDALADDLRDYDHVFSQPFSSGAGENAGSDSFLERLPQARLFPAIVFAAFHPDMVYVGNLASGREAALVPSPLQTYHSAIVLFGHLWGLSEQNILSLFREDVFERLGYLDGWGVAVDDLRRSSRSVGLDLSADLLRWSRGGAFMHGINHPKLVVLADIARRLADEAGLSPSELSVETCLADQLLDDVIWPIYPPVAARYGLDGSYLFKRRTVAKAPPEFLDLPGFIGESLAIYRALPRDRLTCHRIDHWSARPEICAVFDGG